MALYREQGRMDLVHDIEDEFFWLVAPADLLLGVLGFQTGARQFSDLSWGIAGKR